MAVVVRTCKLL